MTCRATFRAVKNILQLHVNQSTKIWLSFYCTIVNFHHVIFHFHYPVTDNSDITVLAVLKNYVQMYRTSFSTADTCHYKNGYLTPFRVNKIQTFDLKASCRLNILGNKLDLPRVLSFDIAYK